MRSEVSAPQAVVYIELLGAVARVGYTQVAQMAVGKQLVLAVLVLLVAVCIELLVVAALEEYTQVVQTVVGKQLVSEVSALQAVVYIELLGAVARVGYI